MKTAFPLSPELAQFVARPGTHHILRDPARLTPRHTSPLANPRRRPFIREIDGNTWRRDAWGARVMLIQDEDFDGVELWYWGHPKHAGFLYGCTYATKAEAISDAQRMDGKNWTAFQQIDAITADNQERK